MPREPEELQWPAEVQAEPHLHLGWEEEAPCEAESQEGSPLGNHLYCEVLAGPTSAPEPEPSELPRTCVQYLGLIHAQHVPF